AVSCSGGHRPGVTHRGQSTPTQPQIAASAIAPTTYARARAPRSHHTPPLSEKPERGRRAPGGIPSAPRQPPPRRGRPRARPGPPPPAQDTRRGAGSLGAHAPEVLVAVDAIDESPGRPVW